MEKLYTCEQVAKRYQVNIVTVWRWIRSGKLPAIRIGGSGNKYRIKESDLAAFENAGQ